LHDWLLSLDDEEQTGSPASGEESANDGGVSKGLAGLVKRLLSKLHPKKAEKSATEQGDEDEMTPEDMATLAETIAKAVVAAQEELAVTKAKAAEDAAAAAAESTTADAKAEAEVTKAADETVETVTKAEYDEVKSAMETDREVLVKALDRIEVLEGRTVRSTQLEEEVEAPVAKSAAKGGLFGNVVAGAMRGQRMTIGTAE
jgi:uncharacterized membrane protein YqiK